MLKEIQFQRSRQTIYAMDEDYEVIKSWPCHDDFFAGYNSEGEPRESLPDGTYPDVSAEITTAYGPGLRDVLYHHRRPQGKRHPRGRQ